MGFFSKKTDYVPSDQQRKMFSDIEKTIGSHGNGFSIRSALVQALQKGGFGHLGLGSAAETAMTSLVGQACGLSNATPEEVDMHCRNLEPDTLRRALAQAASWS